MAHTKRTTHILYPWLMASKGTLIQDDGKASPSAWIHDEKDKRKEDEARCPPGISVQQKVKEKKKKKDSSEKKKQTEGPKEKSRYALKLVELKSP